MVPEIWKHQEEVLKILLAEVKALCSDMDVLQSADGKIKCIFLPKNTTSLIQPMAQEVINAFKRSYTRGTIWMLCWLFWRMRKIWKRTPEGREHWRKSNLTTSAETSTTWLRRGLTLSIPNFRMHDKSLSRTKVWSLI